MPLTTQASRAQQRAGPGLPTVSALPPFHLCVFSSACDLCPQPLSYIHSPPPGARPPPPSVCLVWPVSVFTSVYPLSSCPARPLASPTEQVPGVTATCTRLETRPQGASSEESRYCRASYLPICLPLGLPLPERRAWGGFPLLGKSDRARRCGAEKQKPTLSLHPAAGTRWQALEEVVCWRAAGDRLGGWEACPHPPHPSPHKERCYGVELGLEISLHPSRPSTGRG